MTACDRHRRHSGFVSRKRVYGGAGRSVKYTQLGRVRSDNNVRLVLRYSEAVCFSLRQFNGQEELSITQRPDLYSSAYGHEQ
jgi:hypothetical protein